MEKMKLHTRMYGWKYAWKEFAEEFEGAIDDPNPESSHGGMSIAVPVKNFEWTLVYTLHPGRNDKSHTTVEVNYTPHDEFEFAIEPQKKIASVAKFFGLRDIVIGHKGFDELFKVKSNNSTKVRAILSNQEICSRILEEPTIQIGISKNKTDLKPSPRLLAAPQYLLAAKLPGNIDEFERLKRLYEIKVLLLRCLSVVSEPQLSFS